MNSRQTAYANAALRRTYRTIFFLEALERRSLFSSSGGEDHFARIFEDAIAGSSAENQAFAAASNSASQSSGSDQGTESDRASPSTSPALTAIKAAPVSSTPAENDAAEITLPTSAAKSSATTSKPAQFSEDESSDQAVSSPSSQAKTPSPAVSSEDNADSERSKPSSSAQTSDVQFSTASEAESIAQAESQFASADQSTPSPPPAIVPVQEASDGLSSVVDEISTSPQPPPVPVAAIADVGLPGASIETASILIRSGATALSILAAPSVKALTGTTRELFSELRIVTSTFDGAAEALNTLFNPADLQTPGQAVSSSATPDASLFSTQRIFHFARLGNPAFLLSDSIAAFTDDSASIPASLYRSRWQRACVITGLVLAADIALLMYLQPRYRKAPRSFA